MVDDDFYDYEIPIGSHEGEELNITCMLVYLMFMYNVYLVVFG
jgi:hypothetical protein